MRDSINYNLNYFIMKMSGTKPMKNTMRKKSPNKMMATNAAMGVGKKVSDAASAVKASVKSKKDATAPPAKMKSGMGKKC